MITTDGLGEAARLSTGLNGALIFACTGLGCAGFSYAATPAYTTINSKRQETSPAEASVLDQKQNINATDTEHEIRLIRLADLHKDHADDRSKKDNARIDQSRRSFHDKFVGTLQDTLKARGALHLDQCKTQRAADPHYDQGFQHGYTASLVDQAEALIKYHAEGTSAKAKQERYYPYLSALPDFKLPQAGEGDPEMS